MEKMTVKERYLNLIEKNLYPNDSKMMDYMRKKVSQIVELSTGDMIEIEKPRIEKDFCFGYGSCGYEYDEANKMAREASESENYFMWKNLEGIKQILNTIEEREFFLMDKYCDCYNLPEIKQLVTNRNYFMLTDKEKEQYKEISEADYEILKKAYEVELEKFTKRLKTYLKRYGTSKLNTWSYWVDE